MPDDKTQKEFSREIMALKDIYGFTDAEFAGMLLGAGVVMAQNGGLTKGHIITVVSKIFNDGVANDA